MEYTNYHEKIVCKYSVELIGWTASTFTNPSELGSSLGPIMDLYNALTSGSCKWVKLTEAELQRRKDEHAAKVGSGEVAQKSRKTRKDAGRKRGPNRRTKGRRAA
ncbi:hypothetical protein BDN72DRAFT_732680, partial [Pluteus cervinus]